MNTYLARSIRNAAIRRPDWVRSTIQVPNENHQANSEIIDTIQAAIETAIKQVADGHDSTTNHRVDTRSHWWVVDPEDENAL